MDNREAILARLEVLLGALDIANKTFARNPLSIDEHERPYVALYDGPEQPVQGGQNQPGKPARRIMEMQPTVVVVDRGVAGVIGATLNAHRRAVLKAVMQDSALYELTHDGKSVDYAGLDFDILAGSNAEGEIAIRFKFLYSLELVQL